MLVRYSCADLRNWVSFSRKPLKHSWLSHTSKTSHLDIKFTHETKPFNSVDSCVGRTLSLEPSGQC